MPLKYMEQKNIKQANQNHPAKFSFLYMLSLAALIFTGLSVGMIIFQIINKYIPDPLNQLRNTFSSDQLRFAISALIVAAPVFFVTSRQIYQNLFKGNLDKDSGVRRWLTYFILLVSSIIMLGWFIGLINNYLSGELTVKFILKAITAIGIAGLGFSFYLYDIRREEVVGVKDKGIKLYSIISILAVISVFAIALFLVESPAQVRDKKLDAEIINDLINIESALNQFYKQQERLPNDLTELKNQVIFITDENLQDPETGQPYQYQALSEDQYRLCGQFRTSNLTDQDEIYYAKSWIHDQGEQCFDKEISLDNGVTGPAPLR